MIMLDFLALRLRDDLSDVDKRALDAFANNCASKDSSGPYEAGRLAELSTELQEAVAEEVRLAQEEGLARGRSDHDGFIYWSVMNHFGLDCPHPRMAICERGSRPNPDIQECSVCGTIIVSGDTAARFPLKENPHA